MKLLTKLILVAWILLLTGCVSTFPWLGDGTSAKARSSFKTFDYAGTSVLYRDLSSPCDSSSIRWANENTKSKFRASDSEKKIDCSVATNQKRNAIDHQQWLVEQELSISFSIREKALAAQNKLSSFSKLKAYREGTTMFQIYGAAGFDGPRAEQLGLARAEYVRDQLVEMGVENKRIAIMPYDPEIPGLQAVVKVLTPVIL